MACSLMIIPLFSDSSSASDIPAGKCLDEIMSAVQGLSTSTMRQWSQLGADPIGSSPWILDNREHSRSYTLDSRSVITICLP